MTILISFLVFGGCLFLMAIGLILAKKVLRKGCSIDPEECKCAKEGREPSGDCEKKHEEANTK